MRHLLMFRSFLENAENAYHAIQADIPLPQAVYALSDLFAQHGASLFAVGGAVRDFLHHKFHEPQGKYAPKDVDLATEVPPQEVIRILESPAAKSLGIKVFPKGEAFGVISAVVDGEEYEIATFREEWYDPESGDGRRPDQVSFSTPAKDAQRRDLTMNALFYDIHAKEIRDYNLDHQGNGQGIEDIRQLVARPVGNARDRFREDKLRIPRLIRFFSKYNPGEIMRHLDQNTLDAIQEFRELAGVSPERIANEFMTGLAKAKHPANYLLNYHATGLMPAVFPGMQVAAEDIQRIGHNRNIKAILAWLLRNNGDPKQVRQKLNQLKYPNDISDAVGFLIRLSRFDVSQVAAYLKHRDIYKQLDDPQLRDAAQQTVHRDVMDFARIAGMEDELSHFLQYQPTVRSQDFLHLKGRAISDAMSAAEAEAYRNSRRGS